MINRHAVQRLTALVANLVPRTVRASKSTPDKDGKRRGVTLHPRLYDELRAYKDHVVRVTRSPRKLEALIDEAVLLYIDDLEKRYGPLPKGTVYKGDQR